MRLTPFARSLQRLAATTAVILVNVPANAGETGVTEFDNALNWIDAARCHEACTFDEFFPGIVSGSGCLLEDPLAPVTLELASGSVTISAATAGTAYCTIQDGISATRASDAMLAAPTSVVVFEFDPPVIAFYTYYGSMAVGGVGTMKLYQDDALIDTLVSPPSPHAGLATGHGFQSNTPIDRVEITTNAAGPTLVGAFGGLAAGEQSLGKRSITDYDGPAGDLVELDFGCTFELPESRVHNITQDIWHWCIRDAIDWAVNGDVLVAHPSVYHEAIDLQGKAVTIRSIDPNNADVVASTILNASIWQTSAIRCTNSIGPDGVIDGLTIMGGAALEGGGLYVGPGASPLVQRSTFSSNSAQFGGGIYAGPASSPTVSDCTFSNNTAQSRGGGIYFNQSLPAITGCDFVHNTAAVGGGAYLNVSSPSIIDCSFVDNTANIRGGGLFVENGEPSIVDCVFDHNAAHNQGGAISGFPGGGGHVTIENSTFVSNLAGGDGGAVWGDTTLYTISECDFDRNNASAGAAAYLSGHTRDPHSISNCMFVGNQAKKPGAGGGGSGVVTVRSNNDQIAHAEIRQCVFSGNNAVGIVVEGGSAEADIISCTLSRNAPASIMVHSSSRAYPVNCIFWSDVIPEFIETDEGQVLPSYSNIQGTGGSGNTILGGLRDAEPMFVNRDGADKLPGTLDDDLRLLAGSPCINAGVGEYNRNSPEFDIDGTPRHLETIDLGAYEFPIDCDGSGQADYVEIDGGVLSDCNDNLQGDSCESALDCNANGIIDECDIEAGVLSDSNGNGVGDQCEINPAAITGTAVWSDSGSYPVRVATQDVTVLGNLTINEGVKVMVIDGVKWTVQSGGQLHVNGAPSNPVEFTSSNVNPVAGAWGGIRFAPNSSGEMSHAIVEFTRNHGVRIEGAAVSVEDCMIRDVAGLDQPQGTLSDPALPGGPAYGIFVTGNTNPSLQRNVIERVRGGMGGTGAVGVSGLGGNYGANGDLAGEAGSNGLDANTAGGPGLNGAVGGDAFGIYCGPQTQPVVANNVVQVVSGGIGGAGGAGGSGGDGGPAGWGAHSDPVPDFIQFWIFEGNPPGVTLTGGAGGNGGNGLNGGFGGNGAAGGVAVAIHFENVAAGELNQNLLAEVSGGIGGSGGKGGRGGDGGDGGGGGFGMPLIIPTPSGSAITLNGEPGGGGDGGNGALGGSGGAAGSGGQSYGIRANSPVSAPFVALFPAQNTIARIHHGGEGAPGAAGEYGAGGAAGQGGISHVPEIIQDVCPDGLNNCSFLDNLVLVAGMGTSGTDSLPGNDGMPGLPGQAVGISASGELLLAVANSILSTGDAVATVGVSALNDASLTIDHTVIFGFQTPFGPGTSNQGIGNLQVDPMFVNADAHDFRLSSKSPALDAGNNGYVPAELNHDLDGLARFVDGDDNGSMVVDMGPYEWQPTANPCPGDITADLFVDVDDLLAVINAWGRCAGCSADLNDDDFVDVDDLLVVINGWGVCD